MSLLNKHRNSSGNDNKYYIDCSSIDPSSIQPTHLLKHTPLSARNKFDTVILRAITQSDLIKKKNRHIVVKIGRTKSGREYMAEKEFAIGKQLLGINGFIKFLCIFSCNDDTSNTIIKGRHSNIQICKSDNDSDNKFVLVMPYIKEGSMHDYEWSIDEIPFMKSLIIHTTLSLAEAFIKIGFIHGDLHWGNILFKKTNLTEIIYEIGEKRFPVLTGGYKVVIMDFEKSQTGNRQNEIFWYNLKLFLTFERTTADNQFINWKNNKIISFIERMADTNQDPANKIEQLVKLISESVFKNIQQKQDTYDPNKW
jgi:hypothetical protein